MDNIFYDLLPTSDDCKLFYSFKDIQNLISSIQTFQENIRCMPGYYEKKSETLYNDNVEIKYFWNNSED